MISSRYNLFHLEPVGSGYQNASTNDHEGHQKVNWIPAQDTLEDGSVRLSGRSSDVSDAVKYIGSTRPQSVYFDPCSQTYLYLAKALSVIDKGTEFNKSKLSNISRKMKVADVIKIKENLRLENDRMYREIDTLSSKISSELKRDITLTSQADIDNLLEKLSDYYSPLHLIDCLFLIMTVVSCVLSQSNSPDQWTFRDECGEIIELIFGIIIGIDDISVDDCRLTAIFQTMYERLYDCLNVYYMCNVICCCINENSDNKLCTPYFSPELPVNLALKTFRSPPGAADREVRERLFLEAKKLSSNPVTLQVQSMHFRFLSGRKIDVDTVISMVTQSCMNLKQIGMSNTEVYGDYMSLFQFLHTATVCVLKTSVESARRLLKYYDLFGYGIRHSAEVLKQYMQARCEEESENIDAAKDIYQSLVCGNHKVPLFDQWVACLEKTGDIEQLVQTCLVAASYYKERNMKRREEYYEYRAARYTLLLANRKDDLPQGFGDSAVQAKDDLSTLPPYVESGGKAPRGKKQRVKKKKTKSILCDCDQSTKERKTIQPDQVVRSAKSCSVQTVAKTLKSVRISDVAAAHQDELRVKSSRSYWKDLNELFDLYYYIPHKYRDVIQALSQEASDSFPDDLWVLHSTGWGFHLIGEEETGARLLLRGLRQCLDFSPVLRCHIPDNIHGNFDAGLDMIQKHPEILPDSQIGLNVAAYLSSLAYIYRNLGKKYDERMRSMANHLNPAREARKNAQKKSPFVPKVSLVSPEENKTIRIGMGGAL